MCIVVRVYVLGAIQFYGPTTHNALRHQYSALA